MLKDIEISFQDSRIKFYSHQHILKIMFLHNLIIIRRII